MTSIKNKNSRKKLGLLFDMHRDSHQKESLKIKFTSGKDKTNIMPNFYFYHYEESL